MCCVVLCCVVLLQVAVSLSSARLLVERCTRQANGLLAHYTGSSSHTADMEREGGGGGAGGGGGGQSSLSGSGRKKNRQEAREEKRLRLEADSAKRYASLTTSGMAG
jgi:uncharacterized membrane protein YgcG